jgi:L-fuconolactonase
MIDSHQHIWRLDRPDCAWPRAEDGAIYRDYSMADLRAAAAARGIDQVVLVQSQESEADTRWLLETAQMDSMVAGVVGWCDMTAENAVAVVRELAADPRLVGLRPMVQDRPADWYDQPAIEPAIEAMIGLGLRLDALVRVQHLASLQRLAQRYSGLPIVIDHAAKPRIGDAGGFSQWLVAIAPLAEHPNVYCKLSGLLTECNGCPPCSVHPYVDALLRLFGPDRLMWGSDWPVLEGVSYYAAWLEMAKNLVPASAHAAVFEGTARRFYGLPLPGGEP